MIDTRRVTDRRALRFERFDDVFRDIDTLLEAEHRGTLRTTGNWTLGQSLGHLAWWASVPFEGYPEMQRPPWLMRKLLRLFKGYFLNGKVPVGMKIPGTKDGTFGVEVLPTEEGLSRLRSAFARLNERAPDVPNPVLGPLTHDEWQRINLRHAELHLSFFHS